ncbi:hypothetical protein B0H13DRAFT_1853101 [Mycena leptocephala]|nr:hypothetical protein B0H13DRAFT_1853101 [Mycena leptocephala]
MASFSTLPLEIGDLILQQLPRRALVECCLVCRGILTAIQRTLYRRIEISAQQLTLLVNMSPILAELVHEFTVVDADHQLCNTTSTETLDGFNDNIATVLQSFKNIEHIRILAQGFCLHGQHEAVWQSSLIKFLSRHPSVLQLQIRFPAVPSLPCCTMIESPPFSHTRASLELKPQLPSFTCLIHTVFSTSSIPPGFGCIFTKPATSYPAGTDSSEQLRRPPQSFNHIYMCAGGTAVESSHLRSETRQGENQRALNTQIMPEVVPRAQRAEDDHIWVAQAVLCGISTPRDPPESSAMRDGLTSYKITQLCPGSFLE